MSPVRQRWALLGICLFAIGSSSNYTSHGALLSLIAADFGLSSATAGSVATAFFIGAGATMLFAGVQADRLGARRVVTVGFALVALSNVASGLLAPSFPSLLAWRAIGGMGAGIAFAGGSSYTRNIFAGGRGGHLAQGLFGAAFLAGSGGSLLIMPLLAGPEGDWRRAFVWSGLAVATYWAVWARLAPEDPRPATGARTGLKVALEVRNTWILGLCHMCGFGFAIVVGTWATAYLARTYDLPIATAGGLGSLILITGIAARSLGGAIMERGVPLAALVRGSLLLTILGLSLMALPSTPLAVAIGGLLVTGFGVGLPYAAVFNGASMSAPRSPASAQALVGWSALIVVVLGPPWIGFLLDLTGSFTAGFATLAAFGLASLVATAGLTPIPTLTTRPQQSVQPGNISRPALS